MIVCIAEKPSVAQSIAAVLGARVKKDGYYEGNCYQVTWTFGHLCQLKQPDGYCEKWKKWGMDVLPMIPPQYQVELINNPGIKRQFKVIKDLYKKANSIVNCGDAGQEGELIQRWVMQLAGVRCPVKRLWISSLTEEAIRQGFQNLRPQSEYDSLYEAGLARAEGDWLLGMNCTRLYTIRYGGYRQVLSVGRVQTPTLAMIVARDKEIENFHPESYWLLTTKYRDVVFTCVDGRFDSERNGEARRSLAMSGPLVIQDVKQKKGSEQPPQLYDLTSLQVDCNRRFSFSADTTLKTVQSLYERKLTTYPRVDTRFLTDDIYDKCPDIIEHLASFSECARPLVGRQLPQSKRVFDNSKVTDHHAIIPTGDTRALSAISDYERKVYDLIVRRFCAVFFPDCQYAQTTVLATAGGVSFKATGRTILAEGWRACYPKSMKDEDEEEKSLPQFRSMESGKHDPTLERKLTTPPHRFTEASLLQSMETAGKLVDDESLRDAMKANGIGRPSSRAGIIETLLKRGYIRREKRNLISNQSGRDLIATIQSNLLKSPELTGLWERKLRDIEHGHFTLDRFMNALQQQLTDIIREVQSDTSTIKISKPATARKQ